MTHDEALLFLRAEIALLRSVREPVSVKAAHAMAERLEVLVGALGYGGPRPELTSSTHGVISDDMMIRPTANLAKAKTGSEAPRLHAVLDTGWSVRALAEKLSTTPFEWNEGEPVKISHNYLGRMLKGEADLSPAVKRAVREITKAKL